MDRETVTLIGNVLRVQGVTIEGEVAGTGSRGGGRGPEEAIAGDRGGLTRVELEIAGERNRKWSPSQSLNHGINMGASNRFFIG